jgi:hypothetical protein
MHCHIEPHFLEGMAMVINEGYDYQNVPPDNLVALQCGKFNWTVEEFNSSLNMPTERRSAGCMKPLCSSTEPSSTSDDTECPTSPSISTDLDMQPLQPLGM